MSKKPKRNEPCSCGSGKKYKSCCWSKEKPQGARPSGGSSLFGRVQGGNAGAKKTFKAKVISSGPTETQTQQPKDLVYQAFSSAIEDEQLPLPEETTIAPAEFPEDYQAWEPEEKKES